MRPCHLNQCGFELLISMYGFYEIQLQGFQCSPRERIANWNFLPRIFCSDDEFHFVYSGSKVGKLNVEMSSLRCLKLFLSDICCIILRKIVCKLSLLVIKRWTRWMSLVIRVIARRSEIGLVLYQSTKPQLLTREIWVPFYLRLSRRVWSDEK